eukprot:7579109-Pyramimonas_sp.AAC.2
MEKSAQVICPDMDVMDLIPDELRGIIFLVNANLDPSERATMVAALDDWKSDTAIDKVKYAWPDKDLTARDNMISRRRDALPEQPGHQAGTGELSGGRRRG